MNTFKEAVAKRDFVITAEGFLKPETDAEAIRFQADLLREHVDAVLLTDNQFGALHMSTVAAARLMLDNDLDPIVQLSCRNRNRISLLADLLGAASMGVSSVMLLRGNRIPSNVESRPKAVMDVSANELIAIAAGLKTDERPPGFPELFVGGTTAPHEPKADWEPRKLLERINAGAQYFITFTCMDTQLLRRYMKRLVATRLTRRVAFIVSLTVFSSAAEARWMRDNRPNVQISDAVVERMDQAIDPRKEGIALCAEQLSALAQIPGVSGANIMATTDLSAIPEAIKAADFDGSR
jgi:methylenetetrahydrofolate reductase (NADPH)